MGVSQHLVTELHKHIGTKLLPTLVSCEAGSLVQQHKRSQGCRGKYTAAIATQLEDICEDCYNLYKEPDVHQLCRADCFSTAYFPKCLQALLLEEAQYME